MKIRTPKVNAEDFTFGVEIECAVPTASVIEHDLRPGGYHRGYVQDAFRRIGLHDWVIQSDSSLRFQGAFTPMEVTSPILRGVEGVAQVIKMVEFLREIGAKVNASCGLHVTVGHEKFKNVSTVAQIIVAMYHRSDALVAVGASFGRRTRTYSRSLIHKYGLNHDRKALGDAAFVHRFMYDRRQALNVTNYRSGRLEFRLYAGTLNTNRMLAAIWNSLGLCQNAMSAGKLYTLSTGALGTYADANYYRTNVETAFKVFGWDGKGWDRRLGVMIPDHFPADTFDKVVAQIRKDAKRMDEANARVGYTARVPRPARRPRNRQTVTSPSSTEGE